MSSSFQLSFNFGNGKRTSKLGERALWSRGIFSLPSSKAHPHPNFFASSASLSSNNLTNECKIRSFIICSLSKFYLCKSILYNTVHMYIYLRKKVMRFFFSNWLTYIKSEKTWKEAHLPNGQGCSWRNILQGKTTCHLHKKTRCTKAGSPLRFWSLVRFSREPVCFVCHSRKGQHVVFASKISEYSLS
jgi:hypothetical protein